MPNNSIEFEDNILIGDEGLTISNPSNKCKACLCKSQDILEVSSFIKKIFDYAKERDQATYDELKTKLFAKWWFSWEVFFNLNRIDYIVLLGLLPEILLFSGLIPKENIYSQHFSAFKRLYKGISLWVAYLTDYDDLTPKPGKEWEWCFSEGCLSKSKWDLSKAVLAFAQNHQDGLENFFHPSGHLWFWVELGECLQNMENQGLIHPLSLSEIPTKDAAIKSLGKHINFLKYDNADSLEKAKNFKHLISSFHRLIEGKGMRDEYLNISDLKGDPFKNYVSKKCSYRNQAIRSNYKVAASYVLPEKSPIGFYLGEKHTQRPKPPKQNNCTKKAKRKIVK